MSPTTYGLQYLHAADPTDIPANGEIPVYSSALSGYVPTPGLGGNVTAAGTLTSNAVIIGQGTTAVAALGSLGTTTTLLHGNAAGAPTFATVVEADITLADNTTNNSSTSAHGFLKKLDNNAAHFMDGQGNWSTPSGAGNVSASGTLTSNQLVIGQGSQSVATLGSLGTTTTVLHGNAAGAPSFGAVSLTADVSGVLPVANGGSRIVQIVDTQTGSSATGSTTIPFDDSIPQNTEGDEYMTLAITPSSSSNKLIIQVLILAAHSTANTNMTCALFQDSTADALAAQSHATSNAANLACSVSLTHYMTAGTTSSTTFKVRVGASGAGTTTFNGSATARRFGGVAASSITITEVAV